MRCTRCDGIAVPQAVGRTPDGQLVFGWCLRCLEAEGCRVDEPPAPRPLRWRTRIRRLRRLARRSTWAGLRGRLDPRRLVLLLIAAWMLAWAAGLTAFGVAQHPGPLGDPKRGGPGWFFLGGGGLMALAGLGVWLAALDRPSRARVLRGVAESAGVMVALLALSWGIARHDPRRAPWLAAIALAALGLSWLAHRAGRRGGRARHETLL